MEIEHTPLSDLLVIIPDVYQDKRGYFSESFNQKTFSRLGLNTTWLQDNQAYSVKHTIRALHFQRGAGQAKLVRCVLGTIWDVAVDIRPDSPTFGKWHAQFISESNHKMMYIPAGFAHGYAVISDGALCTYKCDKHYDPDLEDGIAWNDPDLSIEWPVEDPLLSERDWNNQSFQEFVARFK